MNVDQILQEPAIPFDELVSAVLRQKSGDVHTIPPNSTVYKAIGIMAEKHVGCLLVMDQGALSGIVSERDYARKVILQGRNSHSTLVREIMTREVATVTPDHTVGQSMQLMTERRVRHLPVMDGNAVIGVLSIGDLVNCVVSAQRRAINELRDHIAKAAPGYPSAAAV